MLRVAEQSGPDLVGDPRTLLPSPDPIRCPRFTLRVVSEADASPDECCLLTAARCRVATMGCERDRDARRTDLDDRNGCRGHQLLCDLERSEVLIGVAVDFVRYVSRINGQQRSDVRVRHVSIVINSNHDRSTARATISLISSHQSCFESGSKEDLTSRVADSPSTTSRSRWTQIARLSGVTRLRDEGALVTNGHLMVSCKRVYFFAAFTVMPSVHW
jgi:hypothetical protein